MENTAAKEAPKGEPERIAYEIAVRALAQQEGSLDDLRGRAGTLLAASSIVTSFLGGRALDTSGLDGWTTAALSVFAATVAASIYVLWPRADLIFAVNGPRAYEVLYGQGTAEIHRTLAYWIQGFRNQNQDAIIWLNRAYSLGAAAVVLDVILWGGALTR
jgi:hypothetical protein